MLRTPSAARARPARSRRTLLTWPLAAIAAVLLLLGQSAPAQAAAPAGVVSTASSLEGTPYRHGGTTPSGFDCSGFVGYVFRTNGMVLPRTAAAMRAAVSTISRSQATAGDLVFVHKGRRVSHVAIVAADGRWWEATRPGRLLGLHHPWTSSVSFGRPG